MKMNFSSASAGVHRKLRRGMMSCVLLAVVLLEAACGGGGGGSSSAFANSGSTSQTLAINLSAGGTVTSVANAISCTADCSQSISTGDTVTLTANPSVGYIFSSWSGGCSGASATCTVNMAAAQTVTATFTPTSYTLGVTTSTEGTVTSSSGAINCGSTCSASYPAGTALTLTATPNAGYVFASWTSGPCIGSTTSTCAVTMNAAQSATATFNVATYALSVTPSSNGTVTSSSGGISCGSTCSASYAASTSLTLTASPASGYNFSSWTSGPCNGSTTATCTFTTGTTAQAVSASYTAVVVPPGSQLLSISTVGSGTVTSNTGGISCGATCSASYSTGASVTLTASPAAGYTFTGWSGGSCTGTSTCVLTMSAAKSATATFTQISYALTVTAPTNGSVSSSPSGISCGSTCSASYASGTSVTLTATPAAGYTFTSWGGSCSGTATTCTLTMSAAKSVTTTFTQITYSLGVTVSGSGSVSSSPSGISCGSTCSATYTSGTSVTLTATPSAGYTFSGWSGGSCTGTSTCVLTMTAAKSATATFVLTTYTLSVTAPTNGSVSSSPSGISCGSNCSASYTNGTSVTLTASPAAGYTFSSWGGGSCSGSVSTCTLTMNAAKSVTAAFVQTPYALTVTASAGGSVSSSPSGISCGSTCSASYTNGTSVTLTATPASGYSFSGWSGGACSGSLTTCTLSMSAATSVTATFTQVTYTLAVTSSVGGSVASLPTGINCSATTCSASFASGATVTLTETPSAGYTFSGWSGGTCSGTATTCTVTMSGAVSVTATYAQTPCSQSGSTTLASIIESSAGGSGGFSEPVLDNPACPNDPTYGKVYGDCYGNYAVQVNTYGYPPANTTLTMWSQSGACWGLNVSEASDPSNAYWNAPEDTRGFSFTGYNAPLTSTGGISVSALDTQYAAAVANSTTPCPASGTSSSVCVKWAMSVPGVATASAVNTATNTYTEWDALLDIYFHSSATVAAYLAGTFDLQIYQMLMDNQASNGVPNWATNLLGTHTTKTIGGVPYLVSVNMQDPGTENGTAPLTWVGNGNGGTLNEVTLFPLPTYPTGSSSYLWGSSSMVHDVGGIIAWLSQTATCSNGTGICDDNNQLLYDNARHANVTAPLISPSYYLSGLNAGYEILLAKPSSTYTNNTNFTTTNYWVALPGETIGN